jgi:signal transduction histidine kinase
MTGSEKPAAGVALLCDVAGAIRQVIRDDLGIADQFVEGRPLPLAVDRASLAKALSFMVALRDEGTAFDWELNVPSADQVTTLHFAGGVDEHNLLIVAAKSSDGLLGLCDELLAMDSEQITPLRAAIKACTARARAQHQGETELFDELSRLNNDLANLQRELAKKNIELERLDALKNEFLGMAAHDLRNPLSIIQAYSEFLLDEASEVLSAQHVDFLSIIRSSSKFMRQLVDDLLDAAAIESGKLELDTQPTNLVKLVQRNVGLNRVLAEKKQIQLSFQCCDGEIPDLILDQARVEQVLNNLISNAVKFSHPGSTVWIHISNQEDQVVIAVRDEGQGIPADELDKLFRWFGRTSVKGTSGEKSTGLGLVIIERIVQEHHGKIWVESQVGSGTTFYVSLPLDPALAE